MSEDQMSDHPTALIAEIVAQMRVAADTRDPDVSIEQQMRDFADELAALSSSALVPQEENPLLTPIMDNGIDISCDCPHCGLWRPLVTRAAERAFTAEARAQKLEQNFDKLSDAADRELDRADAAQEEIARLTQERDEFKAALSNHLCKYDMADWIACAGGHGAENCEVCDEADKGQHRHALQVRAEAAEARASVAEAQVQKLEQQLHDDGEHWQQAENDLAMAQSCEQALERQLAAAEAAGIALRAEVEKVARELRLESSADRHWGYNSGRQLARWAERLSTVLGVIAPREEP